MRVRALPSAVARTASAAATVLVLLMAPLLTAGPAAAGGPTSVLLTAPAIGRTASLYTTDATYTELAEQVGASMALGSAEQPGTTPSSRSHDVGNAVTLTWLIHDVMVWRVDQVYVDAAGGPWIATQETNGAAGDIYSAPVTWHRSPEPKALVELLGSKGLLAGTSGAAPGEATPPVTAATAAPDTATGQGSEDGAAAGSSGAPGSSGSSDGLSPALAALLGLAVGALLTGLASVAVVRRSAAGRRWPDLDAAALPGDDVVSSDGELTRR